MILGNEYVMKANFVYVKWIEYRLIFYKKQGCNVTQGWKGFVYTFFGVLAWGVDYFVGVEKFLLDLWIYL